MKDLSIRTISVITCLAILLMAVFAGVIMGVTFEELFKIENPNELVNKITSNLTSFRLSVFGWIIIIICDLTVSWGTYLLFKKVNSSLSLLSSWFRVLYTAMLMAATSYLLLVILLTMGDQSEINNQISYLAHLYTQGFKVIWSAGLILFGIHLIILAYLTYHYQKSTVLKLISWMLLIAGIGYFSINTALIVAPQYSEIIKNIELPFIMPMIFGEIGLAIWLLVKKVPDTIS